jgi:fumarate reductase subunit D
MNVSSHINIEPLWWTLFSAGGVVAAFLVPVHIFIFGFAVPLGCIPDTGELFRQWLVKIYLFVLITLPLYHWVHRFYFTVNDMRLGVPRGPLAVFCYGGAIVGTVMTVWVLLQI